MGFRGKEWKYLWQSVFSFCFVLMLGMSLNVCFHSCSNSQTWLLPCYLCGTALKNCLEVLSGTKCSCPHYSHNCSTSCEAALEDCPEVATRANYDDPWGYHSSLVQFYLTIMPEATSVAHLILGPIQGLLLTFKALQGLKPGCLRDCLLPYAYHSLPS